MTKTVYILCGAAAAAIVGIGVYVCVNNWKVRKEVSEMKAPCEPMLNGKKPETDHICDKPTRLYDEIMEGFASDLERNPEQMERLEKLVDKYVSSATADEGEAPDVDELDMFDAATMDDDAIVSITWDGEKLVEGEAPDYILKEISQRDLSDIGMLYLLDRESGTCYEVSFSEEEKE